MPNIYIYIYIYIYINIDKQIDNVWVRVYIYIYIYEAGLRFHRLKISHDDVIPDVVKIFFLSMESKYCNIDGIN